MRDNCPKYFHAAHSHSSVVRSENTQERYNQCQNINSRCTFKSLKAVTDIIRCPSRVNPVPPHPTCGGPKTSQGQLWL
nr:ogr/Delta-like zinc finger family protein [Pantoea ananatis]